MSYRNTTPKLITTGQWLGFIETKLYGGNNMHLTSSDADSDTLGKRRINAWLPLQTMDHGNGIYQVSNGKLYFLKTFNTGSGYVEVHRIAPDGNWKQFDQHESTKYKNTWRSTFGIDNDKLYYVDCNGSDDSLTTLHYASGPLYKNGIVYTINLRRGRFKDGLFFVRNGSVYYVQTRNTSDGKVQVHRTWRRERTLSNGDVCYEHDYKRIESWSTCIELRNITDAKKKEPIGYFNMTIEGDLHFIRYRECRKGRVEVHSALADQDYQIPHGARMSFETRDGEQNGLYFVASDREEVDF